MALTLSLSFPADFGAFFAQPAPIRVPVFKQNYSAFAPVGLRQ